MKKKTNNLKSHYTQDGYSYTTPKDVKLGFADLKNILWPFDDSKRVKREIDKEEEIK